jgi:hypothetical protein
MCENNEEKTFQLAIELINYFKHDNSSVKRHSNTFKRDVHIRSPFLLCLLLFVDKFIACLTLASRCPF